MDIIMQSQLSSAEQCNFYYSKFNEFGFTLEQIYGFFIEDPSFYFSYFIVNNLTFLGNNGFTCQNILDIAQFGGFEVFSHLMLFINPLRSFEYTPDMLVNIVKSCYGVNGVNLLLRLITDNHHSLKVQGFSNSEIIEIVKKSAEIMTCSNENEHAISMMNDEHLTEHGKNIFGL
jgi:hypothetical protein